MQTIMQALKHDLVRVERGYRRMVWDKGQKEWQVYERVEERGHFSKLICSTKNPEIAIDYLLGNRPKGVKDGNKGKHS